MEPSEFTVPDSGKGHIDPEMLDSIRHLVFTGQENGGPIAEGQDGEQVTNESRRRGQRQ